MRISPSDVEVAPWALLCICIFDLLVSVQRCSMCNKAELSGRAGTCHMSLVAACVRDARGHATCHSLPPGILSQTNVLRLRFVSLVTAGVLCFWALWPYKRVLALSGLFDLSVSLLKLLFGQYLLDFTTNALFCGWDAGFVLLYVIYNSCVTSHALSTWTQC